MMSKLVRIVIMTLLSSIFVLSTQALAGYGSDDTPTVPPSPESEYDSPEFGDESEKKPEKGSDYDSPGYGDEPSNPTPWDGDDGSHGY